MATAIDIGTLIRESPDFKGGKPCIAGTGITVMRVAGWFNLGRSPEEIAANWGYINLAQVHAALAYYFANKETIDAALAQEDADYMAGAAAARQTQPH